MKFLPLISWKWGCQMLPVFFFFVKSHGFVGWGDSSVSKILDSQTWRAESGSPRSMAKAGMVLTPKSGEMQGQRRDAPVPGLIVVKFQWETCVSKGGRHLRTSTQDCPLTSIDAHLHPHKNAQTVLVIHRCTTTSAQEYVESWLGLFLLVWWVVVAFALR